MRSHLRTIVVFALAAALLALFLYNVDLAGVAREIVRAHPGWLVLSMSTMVVNLVIRAWRWQYLIEPIGAISFANSFRATAVGFAASAILPARAGEVIRPYFLSRRERVSATSAFATIILERLLDMLTVLMLLAVYVFGIRPVMPPESASVFAAVKWTAGVAAAGSIAVLVVLFVMAGHASRLADAFQRLERILPSTLAGLLSRVAERFATGLGAVRRPGRLLVALALSLPLWLSIATGIWSCALAFDLTIPFSGSFMVIAALVVGVAVPTPGAVGGFHEAFLLSARTFFGAGTQAAVAAAIVLHLFSTVPVLLVGLFFAAQEGLNLAGMKEIAERERPSEVAST